jgi:L-lysine 2,3-aminomutase
VSAVTKEHEAKKNENALRIHEYFLSQQNVNNPHDPIHVCVPDM